MAEPLRIDHTNAECSRRARERQRAGRISLMIEADEVALVLMLIEQNLLPENLQDDKCAITKKRFFQSAGGCKNVFVARSKDRRGRLLSIWQLIGAGGGHKKCKGLCGRRGRKYFGDATHPKDKDAQKLPPKMLAAGFVATSGVKRTAGGHRFWRETGTRPIVRLTSGGPGHGNDGFDVRFWEG